MEIIKLQQFQNNFNSAIENLPNQKFIIENEIKEVIHYVENVPNFRPFKKTVTPNYSHKSKTIFKLNLSDLGRGLFNTAFNEFMFSGSFIAERDYNDNDNMFKFKTETVNQAYEFFEYYKWLNSLINEPKKDVKKSSLTHKQKLLALHYLGLDTSKFENSKTAKILSEILELSEDNTRQYLSYITAGKNEVRTKSNLEKVNQLFENQGLLDISLSIKKDLEKL